MEEVALVNQKKRIRDTIKLPHFALQGVAAVVCWASRRLDGGVNIRRDFLDFIRNGFFAVIFIFCAGQLFIDIIFLLCVTFNLWHGILICANLEL